MDKMKIAVPTEGPDGLSGRRSSRFDHCIQFALVGIKNGTLKKSPESFAGNGALELDRFLPDYLMVATP